MYPLVSLSIPVYTVVEYKKDTKGYQSLYCKGYQRIPTYETINTFERDEYQQQAPSHEYPRPSRHVKGNQQPWYHDESFSNWFY